ncbi:MAG: hypothetical protein WEB88_05495 [Gemmatimonadota bacterium]
MMRFPTALLGMLCLPLAGAAAAPLAAQTDAERLRVYVDCAYCDSDFLRTELTWVDYMRDRADADVHVLTTQQGTGGGGMAFTLEFIGLRDFAGRTDTLRYLATSEDTPDTRRRGLTRTIKLGLVPFVAGTDMAAELDVTHTPPAAAAGEAGAAPTAPTPQNDPWNFWTFSVSLNGSTFGESKQSSGSFSTSLSANRTTEDWKVSSRLSGSYSESQFQYEINGEQIETLSIRRSYSANTLIVKSVGPQFSIGGRAVASMSTYGNTELQLSLMPAVEYNFFPYAEDTRRSLILRYAAGPAYADYREVTLYGQEEETRPLHDLIFAYSTRQPWGSANISLNASQYLHDTQKYSAGIGGGTSVRLFRGFSFNVNGSYTRVRDQLSLPARNLTEEEILLRQRQLATGYNYHMFFGVSYRFGSIFNNVVNPRFGSSGGGVMIMM